MSAARISNRALGELVQQQIEAAAAAAHAHIRNPAPFKEHLLDVALRAEAVAERVSAVVDPIEAPDPVAAFVAGAWHDGGKIWFGDDFHEVASAVAVLRHGANWGLVTGGALEVSAVLRRAAAAIPPGFALYEQWQSDYVPTRGRRVEFVAGYEQLRAALTPVADDGDAARTLMLPASVDALVLMYADICNSERPGQIPSDFERTFDERWSDIERRTPQEDPGLLAVLPRVRARVHDGCALVHAWMTRGYEGRELIRYRAKYCAG